MTEIDREQYKRGPFFTSFFFQCLFILSWHKTNQKLKTCIKNWFFPAQNKSAAEWFPRCAPSELLGLTWLQTISFWWSMPLKNEINYFLRLFFWKWARFPIMVGLWLVLDFEGLNFNFSTKFRINYGIVSLSFF